MSDTDVRRETFAEVSRAMNLVADIWERDGSDPCRVRVTREYANAYRLYAEGLGDPTGSKHPIPNLPDPSRPYECGCDPLNDYKCTTHRFTSWIKKLLKGTP